MTKIPIPMSVRYGSAEIVPPINTSTPSILVITPLKRALYIVRLKSPVKTPPINSLPPPRALLMMSIACQAEASSLATIPFIKRVVTVIEINPLAIRIVAQIRPVIKLSRLRIGCEFFSFIYRYVASRIIPNENMTYICRVVM